MWYCVLNLYSKPPSIPYIKSLPAKKSLFPSSSLDQSTSRTSLFPQQCDFGLVNRSYVQHIDCVAALLHPSSDKLTLSSLNKLSV